MEGSGKDKSLLVNTRFEAQYVRHIENFHDSQCVNMKALIHLLAITSRL
jgi:hypothetical protein